MSEVMPALNAGLFHQTLPRAFDGVSAAGAPRGLPTERPSDVEKSATPAAVAAMGGGIGTGCGGGGFLIVCAASVAQAERDSDAIRKESGGGARSWRASVCRTERA
jgi:hypothetical protein